MVTGKPHLYCFHMFFVFLLFVEWVSRCLSLYESLCLAIESLVFFVMKVSFSPMWVFILVCLSIGMENCSYRLKIKIINMKVLEARMLSNMLNQEGFSPNYVKMMIDGSINNCLIQQIQETCATLVDLVHCSFIKDEVDLILFDNILYFFKTYCKYHAIWPSINEISLYKNTKVGTLA